MEDSLLNVSSNIQHQLLKSFLRSKTPGETPKALRSDSALNNNNEDVNQHENSTSIHILSDNIAFPDESGITKVDDQTYANITRLDDSEDLSVSQRVQFKQNLRSIIRNTKSKREKSNYSIHLTSLPTERKDITSAAVDLENLETEKGKIIQLRKGKNDKKRARIEVESISSNELQDNSNSLHAVTSGEDELEQAKDKINMLRKVKRKTTFPKIDKIITKDSVYTSGDTNYSNFSFSDSSVQEGLLHAKRKPSAFEENDISFPKNQPDTVPSLYSSPTAVVLGNSMVESVSQKKKVKRKREGLNFKRKKTLQKENILSDATVPLKEAYTNSSDESHNLTNFERKKIALKRKAVHLSLDSIIHQVSEAEKQKEIQLKNIAFLNQSPPTAKDHHANSDLSNNTSPVDNLKNSFHDVIEFIPKNNNSVISTHLNISQSFNRPNGSNMVENEGVTVDSSSQRIENSNYSGKISQQNSENYPSKRLRNMNKTLTTSHTAFVDVTTNVVENTSNRYQNSSEISVKVNNTDKIEHGVDSPSKNLRSLSKSVNISHSEDVDRASRILENTGLSKSINISHPADVHRTSNIFENKDPNSQSSSLQVEELKNPGNFTSKSKEDSPSKNLRSSSKSLNMSYSVQMDKTSSVKENKSGSYQHSTLISEKLNNTEKAERLIDSPSKNLRSLSKSVNISHSEDADSASRILENTIDVYQNSFVQVEKLKNSVNIESKTEKIPPIKNLTSLNNSINISHSANMGEISSDSENESYSYLGPDLQIDKLKNPENYVQNNISGNELQANVVVSEDLSENRETLNRRKTNLHFDHRSEYPQEKNLNNQVSLKQPTLKEFLAKLTEGNLPSTSSKEKPLTNFLKSYVSLEKEIPKKKYLKRQPRNKESECRTLSVKTNKKLYEHFSHHKVTKETMTAVQQATEKFFSQFYNDVSIIINLDNLRKRNEGKGHTVHKEYIYTMMKQLGLVNSLPHLHAMMQEMLPASEWQKVIPIMHPFDNVYPKTDCSGKKH